MLNCRKMGLPNSAAHMLTIILNNIIYRIQTGHGLSTRSYQTNALQRILGIGQRSCASPSIWVAVLDPIIWSLTSKHICFHINTPIQATIDQIGDAYIYDTSFLTTSEGVTTISQAPVLKWTAHMEQVAQDFARKLFCTGGRLNLKKCFWYLISWRWEEDGTASMATKSKYPRQVKMFQGYNCLEKTEITRVECDTARRTLGTCKIHKAQWRTWIPRCLQNTPSKTHKIQSWVDAINNSYLIKEEPHMAYYDILHAKVEWSLGSHTSPGKTSAHFKELQMPHLSQK